MDMEHPPIVLLTGAPLRLVFSLLDGKQLALAACVWRPWRDFCAAPEQDDLWRACCAAELDMGAAPVAPGARGPPPSFRAAYREWHLALGCYGVLGRRAWRAWRQVERFVEAHAPGIAASLNPGADEAALNKAEAALGVRFPPALRVLYRIHDGQSLEFDRSLDLKRMIEDKSMFHGVFGGYCLYDHRVSTRFLPLRRMLPWTQRLRRDFGHDPSRVLFAAGHNFNKLLFCDAEDASVLIAARDKSTCMHCVPPEPGNNDGILRWLEAYAAALAAGDFGVEPLDPEAGPDSAGICLFPRRPPGAGAAVTRGMRCCAASVFMPELSILGGVVKASHYFFAYSIRFALLPVEEQAAHWPATAGPFRPLASAQLRARHWVIRGPEGAVESEVRGDGVVGNFPLLWPGTCVPARMGLALLLGPRPGGSPCCPLDSPPPPPPIRRPRRRARVRVPELYAPQHAGRQHGRRVLLCAGQSGGAGRP